MIHCCTRGLPAFYDWTPEMRHYPVNLFYVVYEGRAIESYPTIEKARYYVRQSQQFYAKHGIENKRHIFRFYGHGFVEVK